MRRFKAADENARFVDYPSYHVHLTADRLWLRKNLCIPLAAIRSLKMIKKRGLPNQNALRIIFLDPDARQIDAVYLCDMNILGFYPVGQLLELSATIERLLAEAGTSSQLDDTVEARLPKRPGLMAMFVEALRGTFGSREEISKVLYSSAVRRAAPQDVSCATADDARRELAESTTDSVAEQIDETMDTLVRSYRFVSTWKLLWQFVAPAMVVVLWIAPTIFSYFKGWTAGAVLASGLAAGAGFIVLSLVGFLVMTVLLPPFVWICNLVLQARITIEFNR